MEEVYPFNAEVPKFPDYEALSTALLNTLKLMVLNPQAEFTFVCENEFKHPLIEEISKNAKLVYREAWGKNNKWALYKLFNDIEHSTIFQTF